MNKETKDALYREHKAYISYMVYTFMSYHPTFLYLREDMEAECALKFLHICDKYDGESSKFTTFLYSQLNFYMRNFLSKEIKISTGESAMELEAFNTDPEPETFYRFEEIMTDGNATENQKEILRAKFIHEQTEAEIAEDLGITQQAVHNTIKRAVKKMKKVLGDNY